ncbi:hypothetical protein IWW57_004887, partial [Coemansia sp. S610]
AAAAPGCASHPARHVRPGLGASRPWHQHPSQLCAHCLCIGAPGQLGLAAGIGPGALPHATATASHFAV